MKILFVNRHTDLVGGVEYYIDALGRALKSAGHGVSIIHWDEARSRKTFDKYYRVPELWEDELGLNGEVRGKIDEIIEKYTPDAVYFHKIENGKAVRYLAGRSTAMQYVHDYKTVDPDGKMLLKDPLEPNTYPLSPACFLRAYTRKAMPRNPVKGVKAYLRARGSLAAAKKLKRIIVASGHMKNTLLLNGVKPENVFVLPYFVDYSEVFKESKAGPERLLYAGRIAEGKGLDMLLDVLKFVKEDFMLDVVGTGPDEEYCIKKANASGLSDRVIFRGLVKHENLPKFYSKASFLVMPSVWPEPFGISGIEAAFFGKPAVAFDVGGISEWLKDNVNGYLIKPYDKQAMAEKIDELLRDNKKTKDMGKAGRKIVEEKYLPKSHLDKLLKIFKDLK
jgi:glycosyltransferase involved in cell wall biosynthesis